MTSYSRLFRASALFWIVFLFFITLKSHRTFMGQGDEPYYLVVTESLLLDQDLELSNNYQSPWLRIYDKQQIVMRPDGRGMPYHPIGLSILGIPGLAMAYTINHFFPETGTPEDIRKTYWIRAKNSASFTVMLLASLGAVLLFKLFLLITGKLRLSWLLALGFALAHPLMSFGFLFFTEYPSSLLMIWLLYRIVKKEPFDALDGFLIGSLAWLQGRNYFMVVVFIGIRLYEVMTDSTRRADRTWVRGLVTVAVMGSALLALNIYMWGGISPELAYAGQERKMFSVIFLPIAVPALFMDGTYGLFVYAPIYLLFPVGYMLMWQKQRKLLVSLLLLILAGLIPISGFYEWWGGWCPSTRYLTPLVPFFAVGVAFFAAEAWQVKWGKRFLLTFLALTFVLAFLYWNNPRLLWNSYWVDTREYNYAYGINKFLEGYFGDWGRRMQSIFPNFFTPYPFPQLHAALFATVMLTCNGWLFWKLRSRPKALTATSTVSN